MPKATKRNVDELLAGYENILTYFFLNILTYFIFIVYFRDTTNIYYENHRIRVTAAQRYLEMYP